MINSSEYINYVHFVQASVLMASKHTIVISVLRKVNYNNMRATKSTYQASNNIIHIIINLTVYVIHIHACEICNIVIDGIAELGISWWRSTKNHQ